MVVLRIAAFVRDILPVVLSRSIEWSSMQRRLLKMLAESSSLQACYMPFFAQRIFFKLEICASLSTVTFTFAIFKSGLWSWHTQSCRTFPFDTFIPGERNYLQTSTLQAQSTGPSGTFNRIVSSPRTRAYFFSSSKAEAWKLNMLLKYACQTETGSSCGNSGWISPVNNGSLVIRSRNPV
jgi:hypothetical protein